MEFFLLSKSSTLKDEHHPLTMDDLLRKLVYQVANLNRHIDDYRVTSEHLN
ncbi:hypothetical protein VS_0617 [Vibrio atlanticus]|uniref:Uncharacterized protein n=1 Tax=Vibrio atlanticus (strain LGP32) TaxID=575788 RepID=B7VJT6_VIBA3|nr:hypothetical protein VS_0617 [Vibrio atlanticus]